jgi:NADH-quinone oxidoreductase subunit J
MVLFQQYNVPLQVVGTLILVATIGIVILSKRELK